MNFLPEWAPNLHPMLVHFPIVIFIGAVFFNLISLFLKDQAWLRWSAVYFYVLGGFAALFTVLSGRAAADSVVIPAMANPVLTEHADLAELTAWYFGIYALLRLFLFFKKYDLKNWVAITLFVFGAAGLGLLFETAEHGGELVFKYGVGVQAVEAQLQQGETDEHPESGMMLEQHGSWRWKAGERADSFKSDFQFLKGDVNSIVVSAENDGGIAVGSDNQPILFSAGGELTSIQADVRIKLDKLQGKVYLAHHIQDAEHFDFIGLENGKMKIGRKSGDQEKVFDESSIGPNGWFVMRGVSDGGHFRGYINQKLITHGHGAEQPAGRVGIYIEGTGTISISDFKVTSLKQEENESHEGGENDHESEEEEGHDHHDEQAGHEHTHDH